MVNKRLEDIFAKLSDEEKQYLEDFIIPNVDEIPVEDESLEDLENFNEKFVLSLHDSEDFQGTKSKFRESYEVLLSALKLLLDKDFSNFEILKLEESLKKDLKNWITDEDIRSGVLELVRRQFSQRLRSVHSNIRDKMILAFKNSWKNKTVEEVEDGELI